MMESRIQHYQIINLYLCTGIINHNYWSYFVEEDLKGARYLQFLQTEVLSGVCQYVSRRQQPLVTR